MGVGSRYVIKTALKDFIDDKITEVNSITTSYTQKVQLQCDQLIAKANEEAISIYKEALKDAADVSVRFEGKDLN